MVVEKMLYFFLIVSFMELLVLPIKMLEIQGILSHSSSICNSSTYKEPQFYSISRATIKCASLSPLNWRVTFSPSLKVGKTTRIPYVIKTELKYCSEMNQAPGSTTIGSRYFESVLDFNLSGINIKDIVVRCKNIHNSTDEAAWFVLDAKEEFDLRAVGPSRIFGGSPLTMKPPPALIKTSMPFPPKANCMKNRGTPGNSLAKRPTSPCPNLTLVSDSSGSKYGCFFTSKSYTSRWPVKYLSCYDWTNCQQLAHQALKRTCKGTWIPAYCDSRPAACDGRNQNYTSGVAYCTRNGDNYFLTFFQNRLRSFRQSLHVTMGEGTSPPVSMVTLLPRQRPCNDTHEHLQQQDFVFECSAPKFLALGGFEWTAVYDNGREDDFASCSKTSNETDEIYLEEVKCKVPPSRNRSSNITVTCTVHFQSGYLLTLTNSSYQLCDSYNVSGGQPEGSYLTSKHVVPYAVKAGGIAACLVILFLIIVVSISIYQIRRQRKQLLLSAEEAEEFLKGTTILDKLGRNKPQPATLLPYDVSLEVARDKIKFEPTLLGKGEFGKVIKGRIGEAVVAIKTINKTVDGQYFRALLSELKIMTFVGKHPNIVELIGANTEKIRKQDVYLIFEFCENGNALAYIRDRRASFINQLTSDFLAYRIVDNKVKYENGVSKKLCCEDLIRWSLEIATGMEFIASKNVYHGDLAARNIILNSQLVAKVGDFGLAKELNDYSLYVQRSECPLPLKWMSIESLRDLEFSIQSDVWSYGITLWEMFSLGSTPYPGVNWNFQAWKRLLEGDRMDRPEYATLSIYDILIKCWQTEPKDRPSFVELVDSFKLELEKLSAS